MARGGRRSGAGRPLGSKNLVKIRLARAVDKTGHDDMLTALVAVVDDAAQTTEVRAEAARLIGAVSWGRTIAQDKLKQNIYS